MTRDNLQMSMEEFLDACNKLKFEEPDAVVVPIGADQSVIELVEAKGFKVIQHPSIEEGTVYIIRHQGPIV